VNRTRKGASSVKEKEKKKRKNQLQNIKIQFNLGGRTKKGSALQCLSNTQRQKVHKNEEDRGSHRITPFVRSDCRGTTKKVFHQVA